MHFNVFLTNFLPIACLFLENRHLCDDYTYLQGRIDEVYRELQNTKDELKDLYKDFYKLNTYNQELGRENNELQAAIKHY